MAALGADCAPGSRDRGVLFLARRQALLQSVQQSDAFGTSVEWVGMDNFRNLWNDPTYLASFYTTALFSTAGGCAGHQHFADAGRLCRPHCAKAHWFTKPC
jgi:hypothetical protein